MMQNLPAYFQEAETKLDDLIESGLKFNDKAQLFTWRSFIRNYTKLSVYGFNSAKFDIPAMAGTFFTIGEEHFADDVSALKRGSSYLSVGFSEIIFKDILMLSSPCSLSKYLKTWGVKEQKSIFPHGHYGSVEEMAADTEFPDKNKFYSGLSVSGVSDLDYGIARDEFYRRKNLDKHHADKVTNMLDWLK